MKICTAAMITILAVFSTTCSNINPERLPVKTLQKISADPPMVPERKLLLSFVGDIMAHQENYSMNDYNDIWTETTEIFLNDDLSFGNLETVVDPDKPRSTFPKFNIDPPYVEAAIKAGIDVFSLANNHSADQGNDSMLKTLNVMEKFMKKYSSERALIFSGINSSKDQFLKSIFWEQEGIKIGFLAVTQISNRKFTQGHLNFISYISWSGQDKLLIDAVRKASKQSDVFILSFHGGREYSLVPEPEKTGFFRKLLVAGADIIWAHHPHVLQPWKKFTINGNDRLVMYSLGNFISGQGHYINPFNPGDNKHTGESGITQVLVNLEKGRTSLDVKAIPIVNYTDRDKGIIVKLFDNLSTDSIPEKWYNYYRGRAAELKGMLQESPGIPF